MGNFTTQQQNNKKHTVSDQLAKIIKDLSQDETGEESVSIAKEAWALFKPLAEAIGNNTVLDSVIGELRQAQKNVNNNIEKVITALNAA